MNAALNLDALYPITLTKCCTKCHRQRSIDCFGMRGDKAKPYRESVCRECAATYRRERNRRIKSGLRVIVHPRYLPPRCTTEQAIDAAFMGWGEAGNAFQGGRL